MSVDKKERAVSHEILVVDDTPASLHLLTRILSDKGYRVRPASSGLLALRSVEAKAPDLILLDIKMPDLDGFEVCRRLKGDERSRDIPVLFISGLNESADKVKGFAVGGLDYIVKPFTAEEVLARVDIHLRLHELTAHQEQLVVERTEELNSANAQLEAELAERRLLEETLEEYRKVVECSKDMVAVIDLNYRYLLANEAFLRYRNAGRELVIGRTAAEVLGKETFENIVRKNLDDCFQGKVIEYEMKYSYSTFGERDLLVSYFPVEDAGQVTRVATVIRDITERKRIEEKLQVTQFSVDSSADAIFWVRPDGSFSYANKAACELLGYSNQDFLRLKAFDLNPEHKGEAWSAHWQELRQQKFLRFETELASKDGLWIPVEITANHVELNGQEYNCGFVQDISERKKAESALIDSNERFRAFMDYAPFYAYVKDHDFNHLFANRLTMELISGPKSEVIRSADFFGAELAKKLEEADRRILDGDSDFEELEYLVAIAGKDVWLKDIKFPIVLSDRKRLVGGVAIDITERMRSVEEIRKASREWITAMDTSDDIIYLLDLERKVMRANKPFFMITRSTPETAIGRHIVELVHPEGEKVPCPVCVAQEEKRDFSFIMEPDHPDNPAGLPIEITLRIVRDDKGRPLSMLMTLHDLTKDRKVQEELAEYREHLEELVKARTAEIERQKSELERLNKLFVGRELRMIELKEQIRELENQRGEPGNESRNESGNDA